MLPEQQLPDAAHKVQASVLARAREQLTATRADEQQARHLAWHDSLTALANRCCFHERLEHALADPELRHQGLALLYLDLDGFKAVNDEHGHDAGDEFACLLPDVPVDE